MRSHRSALLPYVALLISLPLHAADFSTPENAIQSLEAAYKKSDLDAAVAAKDFTAEARFMLENIKPEFARDSEILKQTAEVLELSFRKEIERKGFPNFSGVKCALSNPEPITPSLVKVTEICAYSDGGKSAQDLHVVNGGNGWRVVTLPPKR